MNKVILAGRLTADPQVTYTQDGKAIARYTLAIDRMKEGADFPKCVAFDKKAEILEKYCRKGDKIIVEGSIRTGSYENKDGNKVYTTEVMVNTIEFCEKKRTDETTGQPKENPEEGWMNIPDGLDEELPFN